MNIRRWLIGCMFLCVAPVVLPRVSADNVYRINTRAYRHMMATNAHAYRHMMYAQYPSQFGQDIRGFVNNSLLQPQGPVEQLIKLLLLSAATADQSEDSDTTLVAKNEPSPNPDLTSTLGKTRDILNTLDLKEPVSTTPVPPVPVPPKNPGSKDSSHFEELVP